MSGFLKVLKGIGYTILVCVVILATMGMAYVLTILGTVTVIVAIVSFIVACLLADEPSKKDP